MRVKDVMTTDVATVEPTTPLREVAALMADRGVSGVPVVDSTGEVVGVVSEWDIVAKEAGRETGPQSRGALLARLLRSGADPALPKVEARTAAEAMTSPVVTIRPKDRVSRAARLMIDEHVNRLPVVSDGQLVGIVTRADMVGAFTQSDSAIEREIVEDVISGQLWMEPSKVSVSVDHGQVSLAGVAETKMMAELLPVLVERVPGVVGVESTLRWERANGWTTGR